MRREVLVAGLLALGAQPGAHAGLFDGDALNQISELRRQIDRQSQENETRFNRLEEAIKNIGVIQLLEQLDAQNAELAKLRGQIEVLTNQNEQLQKRQRDFYLDLDTRLRRVEGVSAPAADAGPAATPASATAAASPVAVGAPPSAGKDNSGSELRAYDSASNLFKKGDYGRAVDAFTAFVREYPGSQLGANAQYWIGVSYFNLRDYKNARSAEEALIKLFPESSKVPDAMLAIASVLHEQGDAGSARVMLEDIIARFPSTEAAGKARTRLTALRR